MEKIQFDSGVRSYRINGGGILRFNPGDPNVYSRFLEAVEKLKDAETELTERSREAEGADLVKLLSGADGKMKDILNWVFGEGNDFHKLLGGVNLLAVADNGQRVVTNLFEALEPVLVAGARRCAGQQAQKARAERGSRA